MRLTPFFEDGPLLEFMYLVFTRLPGRRLLRSLLCSGDVFQALINSPINLFTVIDAEYSITDHFYVALFSASEQTLHSCRV